MEHSIGAIIKYQSYEISHPSEFLLLRSKRGFWGFPQGHIEKGEREMQTLMREISEETGIASLDIQSFIGKIQYSYFKPDGIKSVKRVSYYFATTSTRQIEISKEHNDFQW